jgi:hypothetical protein
MLLIQVGFTGVVLSGGLYYPASDGDSYCCAFGMNMQLVIYAANVPPYSVDANGTGCSDELIAMTPYQARQYFKLAIGQAEAFWCSGE